MGRTPWTDPDVHSKSGGGNGKRHESSVAVLGTDERYLILDANRLVLAFALLLPQSCHGRTRDC